MLPNLGPGELILIMAVALIVFGPKKLPEIGRGLGNALREFTKARNDFMETLNADADREPPRAITASASDGYGSSSYGASTYDAGAPAEGRLEYPDALDADSADALPYGSDFNAVEGESQPSFRTAQPETRPAASAATPSAPAGEGKA